MFSWRQLSNIVISEFIGIGDVYLPCMQNRMTVSLTTGYWRKGEKRKRARAFSMRKTMRSILGWLQPCNILGSGLDSRLP